MNTYSDASRAEARHQEWRSRTIRRNAARGFDDICARLHGRAS